MFSYIDELEAIFDIYEAERLTEGEIFQRAIELVKKHKFDRDYMFDLNDTIFNRGYSFQFVVPKLDSEKFDLKKYETLCLNVGKSQEKTENLISYLKDVNDFRLGLASIHMLKVKYLISLGYLPDNIEFIESQRNFLQALKTSLESELIPQLEKQNVKVLKLDGRDKPYQNVSKIYKEIGYGKN